MTPTDTGSYTLTAAERNRACAQEATAAIHGTAQALPAVESDTGLFWESVTNDEVVNLIVDALHLAMAKNGGDYTEALRAAEHAVGKEHFAELDYLIKNHESGTRCPKCRERPNKQPGDGQFWFFPCPPCRDDNDE